MHRFLRFAAPLLLFGVAACQEDLRGGSACPVLCPDQQLLMRDTVIDAIALDTTLIGLPPVGSEAAMLLSLRPDTVETAVVVRFDVVPREYIPEGTGAPQPAERFDTVAVAITFPDFHVPEAPITFQVYAVDTVAADLDLDAVRAHIRPNRLVAERSFGEGDTIPARLQIDMDPVTQGQRIMLGQRLRYAIRLVTTESVDFRVFSAATSTAPSLNLRVVTAAGDVSVGVVPSTLALPGEGPSIVEMSDYTLVLTGSPPAPANTLVLGGLPGRRIFFRFEIPDQLVDTTTVVRATLLLTQVPNSRAGPTDTVSIFPRASLANPRLEPGKAALLLTEPGQLGLVPVRRIPTDAGEVALDLAQLVRQWRLLDSTVVQRALVLQGGEEGLAPMELHFHSSDAPDPAVRPRLRVTFVPRSPFGLPR